MKKFLFLFLLVSVCGFSQQISQYQYAIVPSKFDAQKKPGQFGLNNLTKLFLEKNGYTVFYDNDILPPNVSGESCNKIYVNVFSDNTIRTTKLRVEIKDCRNAVLFVSDYGQSSEKDNNVAYNQALRSAFKSFDRPEYRYNPNSAKAAPVPQVEVIAPEPKAKDTEIIYEDPPKIETRAGSGQGSELSAQKILGGYQLVDTTPKIVFKLFTTSHPDVFLAEGNGKQGIVLKKNGQWIFEYRKDTQVLSEPLNVKF